MAVLAHPDDESLGMGGTLAKYASEGIDVFLLTATRGDSGRFRGYRLDDHRHPGPLARSMRTRSSRKEKPTLASQNLGMDTSRRAMNGFR